MLAMFFTVLFLIGIRFTQLKKWQMIVSYIGIIFVYSAKPFFYEMILMNSGEAFAHNIFMVFIVVLAYALVKDKENA